MNTTATYRQTGIRLPEQLIGKLKRRAKSKGTSYNNLVNEILEDAMADELPKIDPNREISPELLAYCGGFEMPSQEEIDNDPRIAHALGL